MKNICKFIGAGGDKPQKFSKTKTADFFIPVISNGIENDGIFGYTKIPTITETSITISARGTIGFCQIRNEPYMPIVRLISVIPFETVDIKYLYVVFNALLEKGEGTSTPQLTIPFLKDKLIPIPSIKTQQSISNIIESANNLINKISKDYREQVLYSNFCKSKILESIFSKESSYKSYYLKDLCKLTKSDEIFGEYPYLEAKVIRGTKNPILKKEGNFVSKNTPLILVDGENSGEIMFAPFDGYMGSTFRIVELIKDDVLIEYLYYFMLSKRLVLKENKKGSAIPHLNKKIFNSLLLPVPSKETQKEICSQIKQSFALLDKITS